MTGPDPEPRSASAGHALLVAWGFPPAKSGGVFRMLETANVLVEEGWRVSVLACDIDDMRRFAGVDLGTLAAVDPRVDVVRVPMELGPMETDLHRFDELRVTRPRAWRRAFEERIAGRFPAGVYALWEEPATRAAEAVHARHPIDVTIASGGPFVAFGIAHNMFATHGIPYVLDYRDSWSLHQFRDEVLHGPGSTVHDVEGELLSSVAEAWFVNEPMRRWHEASYPQVRGRTRVVTNGYDAAALEGLTRPERHDGPVQFGYLGTLTRAVPLAECLAGYARARQEDRVVAASTLTFYGYLGFYTTHNRALRDLLRAAESDGVTWAGPVPKAQVGTVYAGLDALLLTFGGTKYVTSGKVFEYMATGRAIVSVHAPENAVRDVLDGYPLWFQAPSYAPADVARAFCAAAEAVAGGVAARAATIDEALAHARRYDRKECLRAAVRTLPDLVARSQAMTSARERRAAAVVTGLDPLTHRTSRMVGAARRLGLHVDVLTPCDPDTGLRHPGEALDGIPGRRLHLPAATLAERRAEELRFAEPGTSDGRRRALYRAVGALPVPGLDHPRIEPSSFAQEWIETAEELVGRVADIYWGQGPTALPPVAWACAAARGTRSVVDLRGCRDLVEGPFAPAADDWRALLGGLLPRVDLVLTGDDSEGTWLRGLVEGASAEPGPELVVVPDRAWRPPDGVPRLRRDLGISRSAAVVLVPQAPQGRDETEALLGVLRELPDVHCVVSDAAGHTSLFLGAERDLTRPRLHHDTRRSATTASIAEVDAVLWIGTPAIVPRELYDVLAAGIPSVAPEGGAVGAILLAAGAGIEAAPYGFGEALRRVLTDPAIQQGARAAAPAHAPDPAGERRFVDALARLVARADPAPLRATRRDPDAEPGSAGSDG